MEIKLNLNFCYSFSGTIWNMMADENADILFLEIRNDESHSVSFSAVDLLKKQVLWKGLSFDESWWVNMVAIHDQVILFHEFDDNLDPEHKVLFAMGLNERKVIWEKPSMNYLMLSNGKILCFAGGRDKGDYRLLNLKSGKETKISPEDADKKIKGVSTGKSENKNLAYPFHYTEGNDHFETFQQFLKRKLGVNAIKACDYLEFKNLIIISYYIYSQNFSGQQGEAMANHLLVMNDKSEIFLHEKIQDLVRSVGLGTFFIVKDQLLFVKDKKELFSYEI